MKKEYPLYTIAIFLFSAILSCNKQVPVTQEINFAPKGDTVYEQAQKEEKEKNNENVNENNSSISGKERVDNHEVAENESSQNEESKTLSDPEKTNEPNDKVQ